MVKGSIILSQAQFNIAFLIDLTWQIANQKLFQLKNLHLKVDAVKELKDLVNLYVLIGNFLYVIVTNLIVLFQSAI